MLYYSMNISEYNTTPARFTRCQKAIYLDIVVACHQRERFPTLEEALEWVFAYTQEEIDAVAFVLKRSFSEQSDGTFFNESIAHNINNYQEKSNRNKKIALDRVAANRGHIPSVKQPDVNQTLTRCYTSSNPDVVQTVNQTLSRRCPDDQPNDNQTSTYIVSSNSSNIVSSNKDQKQDQKHSVSPPVTLPDVFVSSPADRVEDQNQKINSRAKEIKQRKKPPSQDFVAVLQNLGVEYQTAVDWISHRQAKRSPVTLTAINGIKHEADKASVTMETALRESCLRGWVSFKAAWAEQTNPAQKENAKEAQRLATIERAKQMILGKQTEGFVNAQQ